MLLATSLVTTEKWHSWMAKLSQDATARLPPCPVEGKCLTEGLAYSGTMTTQNENCTYYGSTGNTFKEVLWTQAGSEKRSPARNNFVQQVLGSEEEIPERNSPDQVGYCQQMPSTESWNASLWCLPDRKDETTTAAWRTRAQAAKEYCVSEQKKWDLCQMSTST